MGEEVEKEVFVRWFNEQDKIMSFHYEDRYIRKYSIPRKNFRNLLCSVCPADIECSEKL